VLVATSLIALAAAPVLVLSPVAGALGFVPLPGALAVAIVAIVLAYLACAEVAKRWGDRPTAEIPATGNHASRRI
jgi:Mg2+-importing ATPase